MPYSHTLHTKCEWPAGGKVFGRARQMLNNRNGITLTNDTQKKNGMRISNGAKFVEFALTTIIEKVFIAMVVPSPPPKRIYSTCCTLQRFIAAATTTEGVRIFARKPTDRYAWSSLAVDGLRL